MSPRPAGAHVYAALCVLCASLAVYRLGCTFDLSFHQCRHAAWIVVGSPMPTYLPLYLPARRARCSLSPTNTGAHSQGQQSAGPLTPGRLWHQLREVASSAGMGGEGLSILRRGNRTLTGPPTAHRPGVPAGTAVPRTPTLAVCPEQQGAPVLSGEVSITAPLPRALGDQLEAAAVFRCCTSQ